MSNIKVKKIQTLYGHKGSIYTLEAIDENKFISAGGDGVVMLWNLKSLSEGKVIVKSSKSIYALAYNPKQQYIYIGDNSEGIHKINLKNREEDASVQLGNYHIFVIKIINEQVWVGLSNGELVILTKDLVLIQRIELSDTSIRSIDEYGGQVAVGGSDNMIRIMETASFKVLYQLKGHKNSIFTLNYHPSGKYLVTAGRDAHINVWDTQVDYILRESIKAHLYSIHDLIFLKGGRYFVSSSMDKTVKLWDAHNFKLLKILDKYRHSGHGNSINKLLWINLHNLLVTCSDDQTISIWKIKFVE